MVALSICKLKLPFVFSLIIVKGLYCMKWATVLSFQTFFSKQLWEIIGFLVSNVPLPTPGKDIVFFAIENSLLAIDVPPKDGLPHADVCNPLLFPSGFSPQQYINNMLPWYLT